MRERTAPEAAITVLVAEDDPDMLELLRRVLSEDGYTVLPARDGHEAQALLDAGRFDIVLTDVRMPGPDGLSLLRRAMAAKLHQPVILMTAFGSIGDAVQAMHEGAYHYLAKPFDLEQLLEVVGGAAEQIRELRALAGPPEEEFFPIVFRSQAMARLLAMARDVAASNATILIQGSTGTGKELLARAIHRLSRRAGGPFVPVDSSAIPETLLEAELFGYRRGAFTGAVEDRAGIIEQAAGGTLFLDEVANLSPQVQSKLLRFLQERRYRRLGDAREAVVDVRVISASNRRLTDLVADGGFREDLYYRLAVIPIELPDLKDRGEDIPPLVYHIIRRCNQEGGYRVEGMRRDALDAVLAYPWPGNVRQLENAIERAVILRKAGLLQPSDLPADVPRPAAEEREPTLAELEQRHIQRLLVEHGGNQSRVARLLGIDRRTLHRKLKLYRSM